MMKIITHTALVVAQNKKERVQVLGRGACLKSMPHSPPASLSGSSTNVPATRLERQSRRAQSNRTQGYVVYFRNNYHRLLLGSWNVLTLIGKELKLIEAAKNYHLDVVGVSFTKRRSSGVVGLNGGRKLFSSGADCNVYSSGSGNSYMPQLSDCVCLIGSLWDHGHVC